MDKTILVGQQTGVERIDHIPTLYSDKCLICLSSFGEQPVATLENCQHVFCLECFLQWSKTANTCPVDRISFSVIYQRSRPGGDIQKKIKVKWRRQAVDEQQGEAEEGVEYGIICEECGRSDRRRWLLLCIHCDSGYHIECLTPPLDTVPEGDWICPECEVGSSDIDGCIGEGEVSDGELTDLLNEIDDAVPTSSRLRPSTTNQPRTSSGTRNSQRVQARAARNPTPPSHSCLHVPKYLLRASRTADTTHELVASDQGDARNASGMIKKGKQQRKKCAT